MIAILYKYVKLVINNLSILPYNNNNNNNNDDDDDGNNNSNNDSLGDLSF